MADVRCRLIVAGRVQGVFYRQSCQAVAHELGVRGWVRNRADGTVEVVAEGSPDAVSDLIQWCREGPARAHVVDVRILDEQPAGEVGFHVR